VMKLRNKMQYAGIYEPASAAVSAR